MILTGVILTFFTPFVGHLSDRFGRIRIMVPVAIAIAVLTIPLFMWVIAGRTFLVLALVMIILGLMKSVYFGALPSVMADVFPSKTRATGLSFSYNAAVAVFGGFTPMICAYLIEVTGQPMAPSYYLAVLAGVSIVALASAVKYRGVR